MIIGSFKKVGEGYEGEIVTLTQKIRGIRFVPEANRASDNVPNFRVQIGKLEAGAAWIKHTTDWREYLNVKLDDPTLPGPIFASLFEEEGGAFNLVWSRQRPRNGDRPPHTGPSRFSREGLFSAAGLHGPDSDRVNVVHAARSYDLQLPGSHRMTRRGY